MSWLKVGNAKLSKKILNWSILAGMEVCNRECNGCYALNQQRRWPSVMRRYLDNYTFSKSHTFGVCINAELKYQYPDKPYVRIHTAGEFYSQEYVNKWFDVVRANPEKIFYAYTKRLADFDFSALGAEPNMILIDSLHYKAINFGSFDDFSKVQKEFPDAVLCPDTAGQDVVCGESCTVCMTKEAQEKGIYFIKH